MGGPQHFLPAPTPLALIRSPSPGPLPPWSGVRTPLSTGEGPGVSPPQPRIQSSITLPEVSSLIMATDTGDMRPRAPTPHPRRDPPRPARGWGWGGAPEGLALDAHALGQAAEEGGRALLDHVLHPQAPLDVLQQAAQEAQEVLGRADGAGHRLCGETGSARHQAGGGGGGGAGARRGARLTLQHFVGQHGVGQVGIGLPGGAGLPQPLHQAAVLLPQPLLVRLLDPAGSRGVGRAGPLGGLVRRQGLRAGAPPPEHCLLQGLQVGLAPIQGAAGEVDAHGVDADVVWGEDWAQASG